MPFTVKDDTLLSGKQAGRSRDGHARGWRDPGLPVDAHEDRASAVTEPPPPPPVPDIRQPGQPVKDAALVDQDNKPRTFSTFKGHRLAVTFIYTRCPLPDFCPLMDKHFAAIQKTIASTPALADVRRAHRDARSGIRHARRVLKAHAAPARSRPARSGRS